MKRYFILLLLASVSAYNIQAVDTEGNAGQIQEVKMVDHQKALVNPDMGWTMHFYSNVPSNYGSKLEPSDIVEYFPGVSTVYLRLPWSFIEPEEDKFNWEILDTPAQRWIQSGKKVAFRITSTENWARQGTPQWVFDAGAKYYEVNGFLEPEYDDPIFLRKLEGFLMKMAERYDSNPNVAFVDIGHFGMWGEGHTLMTSPLHGRFWGIETQKKYIDLYCKYFRNTQLCISDDFAGHNLRGNYFPIMNYALSKGVTMRDDSILVQPEPNCWYHSEMAQYFWPIMPVVLEHEHYGGSVQRKAWNKDLLLKAVEEYHAAYMSIHWWPEILLQENRDVIDKINLRMGYRIQVPHVEWPSQVKKNQSFTIKSCWKNTGVAPCYPGGYPCFTLKDSKGGIVSVLVDDSLNVRSLPVDAPGKAQESLLESEFTIAREVGKQLGDSGRGFARSCQPGVYELYVSVGTLDGTPVLELPYDGADSHKRYKLGEITLTE